jgi:hypothetical protein
MTRLRVALFCCYLLAILPGPAFGQSGSTAVPPASNLQNPGARALALGGAVIGLADDASASELNPAGITQIPRNEISIEYRQRRNAIDNRYIDSAVRANDPPYGGDNFACDYSGPGAGGSCGRIDSRWGRGIAYLSAVVHTPYGLSLAVYRHEIERQRLSFVRDSLDVPNPASQNPNDRLQFPGNVVTLDRQLDRLGLAVGYRFSQHFALGFSLNENSLSYSYVAANEFQIDGTTNQTLVESGNEKKFGYTTGLIWLPVPTFQVGAAYSSRTRFDLSDTNLVCSDATCPGPRQPDYGNGGSGLFPAPTNYLFRRGKSPFTLPEKFGVGVTFRPPRFNIVAEVDRVRYSEGNRFLNPIIVNIENGVITGFELERQNFVAPDITEIHAGIEWLPIVSPSGSALALRIGYFREPDHRLRPGSCTLIEPTPGPCPDTPLTSYYNAATPKTEVSHHFTGGFGIVWPWGQIDVGYDHESVLHQDILSTTLVIRP